MTPPRTQRRDATENRAALLAAAAAELNRDQNASLETIASSAGLSRRAVYGHFASRDELLSELIVTGAQRIAAAVGELEGPDATVTIARLGARLWGEVDSIRPMALLAVRGPFRESVAAALAPLRDALLITVAAGQRAKQLRLDLPAAQVARLIEGAALAVLEESTRTSLPADEGARLVVLAGLGAAGLSWRCAGDLLQAHPELLS